MIQSNSPPNSEGEDNWLETDASDESWAETIALGGSLSIAGRRAALAAALPLLGTYFSSGSQPLVSRASVSRGKALDDDPVATLLAGLRLRAAIAASERLRPILEAISRRPTFRYATRTVDVVGAVSGQLDINRLISRAGPMTDPPTFPVISSYRAHVTSENILAYYAGRWVLAELGAAKHAPIKGLTNSPEIVAAGVAEQTLQRVLARPSWSGCASMAQEISRGRQEQRLIASVAKRLRRREVANPGPYQEIVVWMQDSLAGDCRALAGEIDWSFYGERFDTKLFEIWCLHQVAMEVSRQLAVDVPKADLSQRGIPVYVWSRPAGRLELHFQRAIPSVAREMKSLWKRQIAGEGGRDLRGIPDIVAFAERADGAARMGIIDPKLRQRSGPPTDELYKLLGYFANYASGGNVQGAILYHTTDGQPKPPIRFESDNGGVMLAVPLNPAASQFALGFQPVASMLLGLLDIPNLVEGVQAVSGDADDRAERQVDARRRELLALARTLGPGTLSSSKSRLEAQLGAAIWRVLGEEAQTMLATAEHVGFGLEDEADYSGPVLGVCAPMEVLLFDLVIEPVTAQNATWSSYCRTLGQALAAVRNGLNGNAAPVYDAVRKVLDDRGVDSDEMSHLLPSLEDMNRDYRVPAAHRRVLTRQDWLTAWTQTLRGSQALLPRLARALRA